MFALTLWLFLIAVLLFATNCICSPMNNNDESGNLPTNSRKRDISSQQHALDANDDEDWLIGTGFTEKDEERTPVKKQRMAADAELHAKAGVSGELFNHRIRSLQETVNFWFNGDARSNMVPGRVLVDGDDVVSRTYWGVSRTIAEEAGDADSVLDMIKRIPTTLNCFGKKENEKFQECIASCIRYANLFNHRIRSLQEIVNFWLNGDARSNMVPGRVLVDGGDVVSKTYWGMSGTIAEEAGDAERVLDMIKRIPTTLNCFEQKENFEECIASCIRDKNQIINT